MAVADSTPARPPPAAAKTPAANLTPIDLTTIPEHCRAIARQAGTPTLSMALSARLSLATCLADAGIAQLELLDCEASVHALGAATAPSFELIDGVIAAAPDDVERVVAERAKAELYSHMIVKMRATLPAPGATAAEIAMYDARKGILDGLLAPWRAGAAAAYEHILAIVKAAPQLERNPVVASAVRTAKERLKLHVAMDTGEQLR